MPTLFGRSQQGDTNVKEDGAEEARHTTVEVENGVRRGDQVEGKASTVVDEPERSLSPLQHFALWVFMVFMGCQLFLPYTLAAYMVRDFAKGEYSEQTIGQLTGLLAAASSFARSITAFSWGLLSDKTGRKFVILVGNVASIVSLLGLGSATSYPAAIVARALPSFFIGSPVALKSMMGDSCDQTGQAKAMSIFNLGHGLGTVIGPILGGVLAKPCDRFAGMPLCKTGELLQIRPYLLPCLTVSVMGLLALLSNIFLLRETHPDLVDAPGGWCGNLLRLLLCCGRRSGHPHKPLPFDDPGEEGLLRHASSLSRCSTSDLEMGARHSLRASQPVSSLPSLPEQPDNSEIGHAPTALQNGHSDGLAAQGSAINTRHTKAAEPSKMVTGDGVSLSTTVDSRLPPPGPWGQPGEAASGAQSHHDFPLLANGTAEDDGAIPSGKELDNVDHEEGDESRRLLHKDAEHQGRDLADTQNGPSTSEQAAVEGSPQPWYKNQNIRLTMVGSGMIAFLYNLGDELTPIYVSAPANIGGLNMPLDEFTWPIACGGVTLVVFSLVLYPRLMKRFGGLVLCRAGLLGGIPTAILVPSASLFLQINSLKQACLFLAIGLKSIAKVMALNSSMILVNLIAPKSSMGAVNGLAMTLQSGGRALGPLLSGTMWAIVVSLGFPGQQFIAFAVLALALACTQYIYTFVKMPAKK